MGIRRQQKYILLFLLFNLTNQGRFLKNMKYQNSVICFYPTSRQSLWLFCLHLPHQKWFFYLLCQTSRYSEWLVYCLLLYVRVSDNHLPNLEVQLVAFILPIRLVFDSNLDQKIEHPHYRFISLPSGCPGKCSVFFSAEATTPSLHIFTPTCPHTM